MLNGRFSLLVSNEILLEYQEVITREFGATRWHKVEKLLVTVEQLHNSVVHVDPQFRFSVISDDFDDNKFTDCAIVGQADFVVTSDRHFAASRDSGFKPQPIAPEEFSKIIRS